MTTNNCSKQSDNYIFRVTEQNRTAEELEKEAAAKVKMLLRAVNPNNNNASFKEARA